MVGKSEGVHIKGRDVEGIFLWDEDGGAQWETQWIDRRDNVLQIHEVASAHQCVDYVV